MTDSTLIAPPPGAVDPQNHRSLAQLSRLTAGELDSLTRRFDRTVLLAVTDDRLDDPAYDASEEGLRVPANAAARVRYHLLTIHQEVLPSLREAIAACESETTFDPPVRLGDASP